MDEQEIKRAVIAAIEKAVSAGELADVVRRFARGPQPTFPDLDERSTEAAPTPGAQKLLTRIVLGDILDDGILGARPSDAAFPLRLFFAELSRLLAADSDVAAEALSDQAFVLASAFACFAFMMWCASR